MRQRPQRLRDVAGRAVADDRDDLAIRLRQLNAGRRGDPPPEAAALEEEVRVRVALPQSGAHGGRRGHRLVDDARRRVECVGDGRARGERRDRIHLHLRLDGGLHPGNGARACLAVSLHALRESCSPIIRELRAHLGEQRAHRRPGVAPQAERDGVRLRDLVRVGIDLDDLNVGRNRADRIVEERREHHRADDQGNIGLLQDASDPRVHRRQHAAPQRVIHREHHPAVQHLADDARAHRFGERDQIVHRAGPRNLVAGHDQRLLRVEQPARGLLDPVDGDRSVVDRRRRWNVGVGLLVEIVPGDRQEHRAVRRRRGNLERAPHRDTDILGPLDFVRPLAELLGHPHQVGREHRLLDQLVRVLLSGCYHDGRPVPHRVEDVPQAVRDAGRDVQVHQRRPPCRLRVAVGGRDRGRLLQREDQLDPGLVGQLVEDGELGGAGVRE